MTSREALTKAQAGMAKSFTGSHVLIESINLLAEVAARLVEDGEKMLAAVNQNFPGDREAQVKRFLANMEALVDNKLARLNEQIVGIHGQLDALSAEVAILIAAKKKAAPKSPRSGA